jgi:hypothetical protein
MQKGFFFGKPEGSNRLESISPMDRIILKWVLKYKIQGCRMD